jgi:hypothetical protein
MPAGVCDRSRACFEAIVSELSEPPAAVSSHGEVEDWLTVRGRDLLKSLMQDHLDLRAVRERRRADVVGAAQDIPRARVEPGHGRPLSTVFGQVRVERLAYRALGATNLYPADAVLNLPPGEHSHGLRRIAVAEVVRGSYGQAVAAITRATGQSLGKAQVEALAAVAATDIDVFYELRRPGPCPDGDTLVMTFDGNGVVMRPEALRPATAKAAARTGNELATRLSRGEKTGRKRMAEVGAVYDAAPAVRDPADIIAAWPGPGEARRRGPVAAGKWLTASVEQDAGSVIAAVFDEACRRDPARRRTWIALVDGNPHQIDRITAEARRRKVTVTIVCDFIHVLEYPSAPRSALLYPPLSGEGLEGTSLGLMAYLASKEKGDNSTPANRRSRPGVWGGALGDPRDMAKAGLLESQSPEGAIHTPAGKTPETGAGPCGRFHRCLPQPSGARSDAQ